jgi:hypothetical protein
LTCGLLVPAVHLCRFDRLEMQYTPLSICSDICRRSSFGHWLALRVLRPVTVSDLVRLPGWPHPARHRNGPRGTLIELILPRLQAFAPQAIMLKWSVDAANEDPMSRLALADYACWEAVAGLRWRATRAGRNPPDEGFTSLRDAPRDGSLRAQVRDRLGRKQLA